MNGVGITPERQQSIAAFLRRYGWGKAHRGFLAGDMSMRRYERLTREDGHPVTAILMDAPPQLNHSVLAFVAIGKLLDDLGCSVPRLLADAADDGLLLLEDLGDATFTTLLDAGADPLPLYRKAVDVLIHLHRNFNPSQPDLPFLPTIDPALFLEQVMLFADEYAPIVRKEPLSVAEHEGLAAAWAAVLPQADIVPSSLLLRDYHVDNVMDLPDRDGAKGCGVLDFQDAGIGPVAYDLVSLLEDARRDVPQYVQDAMIDYYLVNFPQLDRAQFLAAYNVLGAQRHARILGIFVKAAHNGNPSKLAYLPRVRQLFEAKLATKEMTAVRQWCEVSLPLLGKVA